MIIAVDIETKGLDATKFIMGCIVKEGHKKPEIFHKKEHMWNRIIEMGKAQRKKNKCLNVYAHNHNYDFHGYANLTDSNIKYFSMKPFICGYTIDNKECIKFLDTLSIFKTNLKSLGTMVGHEKLEMPKELLNENATINESLKNEIMPYMVRDAEIVLKSVMWAKNKLKEESVGIKRLYTINQIAINYMLNEFRKVENKHIFWNANKGEVRRTFRREEIHSAYRGGRVECWKTGIFNNVTHVDFNSLYPYSAMVMKFPDLSSERKMWRPENNTEVDFLKNIGISRVMLYNEHNEYGLIPIRTKFGNFYPKPKQYIIGTWTNEEIGHALLEGYKLIDVEWTIKFEEGQNPYKSIIPKLYQKRLNSKTEIENYFYKMVMNASFGKMAQTRLNQEIVIDSVEKADEYLKRNYEIMKGIKYDWIYRKKDTEFKPKKYYCPIIPTLINARARLIMYQYYKLIPINDLIYTDTDSIMFKGKHINKIPLSTDIGNFKIEHEKAKLILYGKKTYSINNNIKISGFNQKEMTEQDFENGVVTSKHMVSIKTTKDINQAGRFVTETRNLKAQENEYNTITKKLYEQKVLRDDNLEDVTHFVPKISKILENMS